MDDLNRLTDCLQRADQGRCKRGLAPATAPVNGHEDCGATCGHGNNPLNNMTHVGPPIAHALCQKSW